MISMNLIKVFILSLFVELVVCSCKEEGWCLTNGQCCSDDCSWLNGCKAKEVSCAPKNSWCSVDEDCCSTYCIKAAGQHMCGEAGEISTDGSNFIKEANENENNIEENEFSFKALREENESGLLLPAGENTSVLDEHLEDKQRANEAKISENPISLPVNKQNITSIPVNNPNTSMEQISNPHNASNTDINIQPLLHSGESNVTASAKTRQDNFTIDIDTTSFENFLSTLQNLED